MNAEDREHFQFIAARAERFRVFALLMSYSESDRKGLTLSEIQSQISSAGWDRPKLTPEEISRAVHDLRRRKLIYNRAGAKNKFAVVRLSKLGYRIWKDGRRDHPGILPPARTMGVIELSEWPGTRPGIDGGAYKVCRRCWAESVPSQAIDEANFKRAHPSQP